MKKRQYRPCAVPAFVAGASMAAYGTVDQYEAGSAPFERIEKENGTAKKDGGSHHLNGGRFRPVVYLSLIHI